ncbi:hypothetical protein [Romboutsia sp.]|nr:hypothetical protein [Romboutsia sp.]HSQ90178.1 hypothetical protein [Romboutsia sp.]
MWKLDGEVLWKNRCGRCCMECNSKKYCEVTCVDECIGCSLCYFKIR